MEGLVCHPQELGLCLVVTGPLKGAEHEKDVARPALGTIIWQHVKADQRPQLKVRRRVLALEELQSDPVAEQLKKGTGASLFLGLERLMMAGVGG